MNLFIINFQLFILFYFLLASFLSLGQLLNLNKNPSQFNIVQPLIFGFCIFVIIINFLFFLFSFKINFILFCSFYFFLFIIIINILVNKKNFLKVFFQLFNISILCVFFFFFISLFYGEQFYVFRGNKWDWFGFVLSGNYISGIDNNDFLNLKNNFSKNTFLNLSNFDDKLSAYHFTVKTWMDKIPTLALLLGLLIKVNPLNPFLMAFFLKIFFLILASISIFTFLKRILKENNFWKINFYTQSVICSFWVIYILEAEYIRYLSIVFIFVYLLTTIDQIIESYSKNKWKHIFIYLCAFAVLLMLYPEVLFFYLPILLLTILLNQNIFNFIKKNFLKIITSIIIILCLVYPLFLITFEFIINQLQSTQFENRWWTYFGAFILGSTDLVQDLELVNYIKNLIQENARDVGGGIYHDNLSLKSIVTIIYDALVKFNYQDTVLNIIPSIFGFYFVTNLNISNYLILLLLSIYLLFIFFRNLIFVLRTNDSSLLIFKSSFIFLIFFGFFLVLKGKLWSLIKLYMIFFPIVYCVIMLDLKKLKPIKFLIALMLFFPIYKFGVFNFGIGKFDSFPSIQKKTMKTEITWNLNLNDLQKCKYVNLNFSKWNYYDPSTIPDHFKSMYLTTYLVNSNFKFYDFNKLVFQSSNYKKICDIKDF